MLCQTILGRKGRFRHTLGLIKLLFFNYILESEDAESYKKVERKRKFFLLDLQKTDRNFFKISSRFQQDSGLYLFWGFSGEMYLFVYFA